MTRYKVALGEGLKWIYFADDKHDDTTYTSNVALPSIVEVKRQFDLIFGSDYVNSCKNIIILHHKDGPECFKSDNLIALSDDIGNCCEFVFEFSHELCHFMKAEITVCDKYRWLEEVLCQLMSIYILEKISENQDLPESLLTERRKIPQYIQLIQKNATPFSSSLSSFVAAHLKFLEKNRYRREDNRAILFSILPLFRQFPQLWKIVPHLHEAKQDFDLASALQKNNGRL